MRHPHTNQTDRDALDDHGLLDKNDTAGADDE
jgi:hypothetical protein